MNCARLFLETSPLFFGELFSQFLNKFIQKIDSLPQQFLLYDLFNINQGIFLDYSLNLRLQNV